MKYYLQYAMLYLCVTFLGCTSEAPDQAMNTEVDHETRQALEEIAKARIFFGHHSVGDNLIAGLRELAQEAEIEIRFVDVESEQVPLDTPVFAHTRPGRNHFPKEKIDDFFAQVSEQVEGWSPDLAAMKLCFLDVSPDTDTQELVDYYESKAGQVRAALDDTVLMHITAPLTEPPSDLASRLKGLIGKGATAWEKESNKNRHILNEKIVRAFPDDPIFDLALAESAGPDGRRSGEGVDDGDYSLRPEYTDDGSHLNELGRRVVAKAFAISLASVLRERRTSE